MRVMHYRIICRVSLTIVGISALLNYMEVGFGFKTLQNKQNDPDFADFKFEWSFPQVQ